MVTLKEILDNPSERHLKRVILEVKVLGRKHCPTPKSYMVSRSDVTIKQGDVCAFSDPLPYHLRGKTIKAEWEVRVLDNKIHLSNPNILEVSEDQRTHREGKKGQIESRRSS